jgi:hypothetical protein
MATISAVSSTSPDQTMSPGITGVMMGDVLRVASIELRAAGHLAQPRQTATG